MSWGVGVLPVKDLTVRLRKSIFWTICGHVTGLKLCGIDFSNAIPIKLLHNNNSVQRMT